MLCNNSNCVVFQPLQPKSHSEPVQWTLPLREFVKSGILGLLKIVFFQIKQIRKYFFSKRKIANLCCHIRCQITPFPEHIRAKMGIADFIRFTSYPSEMIYSDFFLFARYS